MSESQSLLESQTHSKAIKNKLFYCCGSYSLYILFAFASVALAVILISTSSSASIHKVKPKEKILLISLDGFRPDYLDLNVTPTLNAFRKGGTSAEFMIPVFPSITFPNHYSIVTGLYPQWHGIVANTFYSIVKNDTFYYTSLERNGESFWWKGEPLWVTARKQGKHTGVLMWPGSEAEILGYRPHSWVHYNSSMTLKEKMDLILSWRDEAHYDFISLYIPNIDVAGHESGAGSQKVKEALQFVDEHLSYLFTQLERRNDDSNIIIVSDHGMSNSSLEKVIYLDNIVDLSLLRSIDNGPLWMIYPLDSRDTEAIYNNFSFASKSSGHFKVYKVGELENYDNEDRVAPIVLHADLEYVFTTKHLFNVTAHIPWPLGMHGYSTSYPSMHSLFLAKGPAFRKNFTIPPFSNVQLYQLMCKILRVKAAPNNGSAEWLDSQGWLSIV